MVVLNLRPMSNQEPESACSGLATIVRIIREVQTETRVDKKRVLAISVFKVIDLVSVR